MSSRSIALLAITLSVVFFACQTVPYTHRTQLMLVSSGQEKSMGLTAYQETLKKAKLSSDQEKVAMIRRIGYKLAKAANRPDFQWEFNLIEDDKTINAWCLPGGKVAVYTGILPVTQNEDGMAVVMGHEISHALARHGAERMSQQMPAQFGAVALSVALANKPRQTQELFGQAYGLGVTVGVLLPYSRGQESEADHIGLILMSKAGYDPHQAVEFWKRMEKATADKKSNDALSKYLSTHPPDQQRIRQIEEWMPEAELCQKSPDDPKCKI